MLGDRDTYISGKGNVFNIINQNMEVPPGLFIAEDQPQHSMHRGIVSRLFTPRRLPAWSRTSARSATEIVDDLVGRDHFDFMHDFALKLPVQVIGMLVGVPKEDQAELLAIFQTNSHEATTDPEAKVLQGILDAAVWFNEYLDWREQHPSDDVMTRLMQFEFEDETGVTRTLRRDEIVTYLTLITAAGSDTTATAIAWAGSLLGDHPDQRRELVRTRGMIPQAFEEVLRYEQPSYHFCRWTTKDTEFHGQTVPAESILVMVRRGGEPRRDQVGRSRALRHPPRARAGLHVRLRSALLPRREPGPDRGAASRWRRSWNGSRSGRATTTTRCSRRESTPAAGNSSRSPFHRRQSKERRCASRCW